MDDPATLVIGQRVRVGLDDEYDQWNERVKSATTSYPGYVETIVREPNPTDNQWVTVVKFDSVTNMRNWLNSSTRQTLLDEGQHLFDGPATQQVIAGRQHEDDDTLATVVVNFRVAPERSAAFLQFQHALAESNMKYPGFRGSEVFRPIEGVQDHWTVLFRFDNVEHLDAWLVSDDRRKLLRNSEFGEFEMKRVDHTFGSWFADSEESERPPSRLKTTVAVWLGLYPTVMLLTLALSPLHLPLWQGLLIGNLLSAVAMTYLAMPYYVNPLLGWYLSPKAAAAQPATNIRGLILILVINAAWALAFYLLTDKVWTPP